MPRFPVNPSLRFFSNIHCNTEDKPNLTSHTAAAKGSILKTLSAGKINPQLSSSHYKNKLNLFFLPSGHAMYRNFHQPSRHTPYIAPHYKKERRKRAMLPWKERHTTSRDVLRTARAAAAAAAANFSLSISLSIALSFSLFL